MSRVEINALSPKKHKDQRAFLHHVKEAKPHLFGFIQNVSLYQTVQMTWSEANLRFFHDLSPSLPLHVYATGNLARKIFLDTDKMQAMIIQII